ncbi:hypothetical protein SIID45300_02810 [Candidatus Magnetaquicoccaceae bacterium FCR-1]|uniref:DUF4276 family protein n=1 Tax=Candidatus Magnetaquiglobus chichijimensis TaxID=3141448 RepID=A0ABQ0CC49_9PROT
MIRVHVICEGQTEEAFVHELLVPWFNEYEIKLTPRLIGKPGHKGGRVNCARLFEDVQLLLNDKSAYCTTLIDYYGMENDVPGKVEADRLPTPAAKAACLTTAIRSSLQRELGEKYAAAMQRFIPYVQLHEFEALLFSDPERLARGIFRNDLADRFQTIRNAFATPENINDSPLTAPAKRISRLVPDYEKPLYGSLAALEIGLEAMRRECALFRDWMDGLAALPPLN